MTVEEVLYELKAREFATAKATFRTIAWWRSGDAKKYRGRVDKWVNGVVDTMLMEGTKCGGDEEQEGNWLEWQRRAEDLTQQDSGLFLRGYLVPREAIWGPVADDGEGVRDEEMEAMDEIVSEAEGMWWSEEEEEGEEEEEEGEEEEEEEDEMAESEGDNEDDEDDEDEENEQDAEMETLEDQDLEEQSQEQSTEQETLKEEETTKCPPASSASSVGMTPANMYNAPPEWPASGVETEAPENMAPALKRSPEVKVKVKWSDIRGWKNPFAMLKKAEEGEVEW